MTLPYLLAALEAEQHSGARPQMMMTAGLVVTILHCCHPNCEQKSLPLGSQ